MKTPDQLRPTLGVEKLEDRLVPDGTSPIVYDVRNAFGNLQISQMKPIEGGVSASQDGIRLYLTVPSGTEVVVGDISLLADSNKLLVNGHDDPWFVRANEKGIFEVPMRIFKVLGVPEIVVGVRKPDGQIVNSKVENIAGKVTLLPGDVTLVEGVTNVTIKIDVAVSELLTLIKESDIVVGVASGVTHISSQLGQPSVVLCNLSDPCWLPTYAKTSRLLYDKTHCSCSGEKSGECSEMTPEGSVYRCLYNIKPESVVETMEEFLKSPL
jgi:hypothetical protein